MKRVLITGWHGFLGSAVTDALLAAGFEVYGISRSAPDFTESIQKHSYFHYITGDLTNEKNLEAIPEMSCVIHAAGNVSVATGLKNPRADFDANVRATFNILEWCRAHNNTPILFVSTGKIYPLGDMQVRSVYGTSKYAADLYVQEYYQSFDLPVIINRFGTLYGPGQRHFGTPDRSWVNWFIEANFTHKPIVIIGEGDQVRDPLYVGDAARLIVLQLTTPTAWGQIYDVGAGNEHSITPREIIALIEKTTQEPFVTIEKKPMRPDIKAHHVADISQLSAYWKPAMAMEEGIKLTKEWLMENIITT